MMQIMDIIPQVMTQFNPGKTGHSKQSANKSKSDTQFSDVLSSVRTASNQDRRAGMRQAKIDDNAGVSSETPEKTDIPQDVKDAADAGEPIENDVEETDDVAAISILGQTGVVLILEGNKEIDAASEEQQSSDLDDLGIAPKTGAPIADGDETTIQTPVQVAETDGDKPDYAEAERMARMPETTDKPREEIKTEKRSDEGDLCPLENENEVKESKGKKDVAQHAAYSDSDESAEDDNTPTERVIPTNQTVDVRPERLASSEQLKGAAEGQPVTQDNLFDAMVEKIETMKTGDMNRMSIQLKPEFLGKVSLQLSLTASGLQVRINADDLNVRNAIGSQIHSLIETLSAKGIQVTEVEVMHTGAGVNDFTRGQGGNAQPEQGTPSRRRNSGDSGDLTGFEIPPIDEASSIMDDEISSVEYRA